MFDVNFWKSTAIAKIRRFSRDIARATTVWRNVSVKFGDLKLLMVELRCGSMVGCCDVVLMAWWWEYTV